ncbi:MAG: hypothetical protein J0626_05210, partial [Rhodospirillaceae bacterium]|nr:hypothetical protein [Rhodospirillaceae bacterium]
ALAGRLRNYKRAGNAQPLQFKENRPTLPALFFPAPTLIAFTDPRLHRPADLKSVRKSMFKQVSVLLKKELGLAIKKKGGRRPLWKLLAALEVTRESVLPLSGLPSWHELRAHWRAAAAGQEDAMHGAWSQWTEAAGEGLGDVTQSEVAALAEFALSGPGVALGRALFRFDPECLGTVKYGQLLNASWNGLRPYLNRAVFQAVLTRRGQRYTHAIPEAVLAGNLESVLDEHLWIASKLDADAVTRFPRDLVKALGLH